MDGTSTARRASVASRLNNLQVLRAYAALSVVLFHTGFIFHPLAPFGVYGVDVFFVISGYIMASICDRRPRNFLKRRIIRIVPLYWLATLFIFALAYWKPQWMTSTEASWTQLWKSLLFIPYFKGNGLLRPMLFVGWSLNFEMTFYLLLALGLLLLRKRAAWFACTVIVLLPPVLALFHPTNALGVFYQDTRQYEFALGVIAYYLSERISSNTAWKLRWWMAALSLLAAVQLPLAMSEVAYFAPPPWLSFGIPGFILVVSAVLAAKCGLDTKLGWLVLLGDASYAMYLLHPYVLYLQERVLSRHAAWLAPSHSFVGLLLGVVVVSLVSVAVYLWLEKPLVDWLGRRFAPSPRSPEPKELAENPL